MEPQPAGTTRPYTPTDCRKEAWLQGGSCLAALVMAISPPHWTFIPRWAITLLFLALAFVGGRPVLYWLLLSVYMGQTVTYRIGPRGHAWWQRTVTYSVPQMSAKAADQLLPTPFSIIITLALTGLTGAWTFAAVGLFSADAGLNHRIGIVCLAIDIPLVAYTLYCWKRVGQDRQRLKAPQDTP